MSFSKILFVSILSFVCIPVRAAELKIVKAFLYDIKCSTSLNAALEMVRKKAMQQFDDPSKYQQISRWDENVWTSNPDLKDYCQRTAYAAASFLENEKISEDWYVNVDAAACTLSDKNDEGWGADSHAEEGWANSLLLARTNAVIYCGGKAEPPFLIERIGVEGCDHFGRSYKIKAHFKCIKP